MAVSIPVPDVARFDIRATVAGKQVETSFCFRRLSPPITLISLSAEATRLMNAWRFNIRGLLASDVTYREVFAVDLSPTTVGSVAVPFSAGSGTQGPSSPTSIAISLLPLGPTLPRPWQWRVRFFGWPESRTADNLLDAEWAAAFRTVIRDNYTLQGAFGWAPCVVQRVVNGSPLAVGVPYDVTGFSLPTPFVSPMRRRLTGR